MESTNIRVKLNSVEQVRQFVETMRKYDGDVDVYSSNGNYLVDATESFINTLQPFMLAA